MYENGYYEDGRYIMSLFCVGRRKNPEYLRRYPRVPQIIWEEIANFIYNRFFQYCEQKSINRQWDQTGRYLWRLFEQCNGEENGQLVYKEKIIGSLYERQQINRNG